MSKGLLIIAVLGGICILACAPAFAGHPVLRNLLIKYYENHHHHGGAPAPLLAAGIPAFIALGGGAAVTKLTRRFRRQGAPEAVSLPTSV